MLLPELVVASLNEAGKTWGTSGVEWLKNTLITARMAEGGVMLNLQPVAMVKEKVPGHAELPLGLADGKD